MSTSTPSRRMSPTLVGAAAASVLSLALYLALPPQGPAPPEFLEFLGRFHTMAVHLPVGVLLLVASAELLTRWPRLRERIDPALDLALPFLLATAVAAFSLGLLLARGGGYPPKLVGLHRAFTLGAVLGTAGCLVAWSSRLQPDGTERRLRYRAVLLATVGLLTIGAHFGGSMTHGDTYLTRYAPAFVQKLLGAPPPAVVETVVPDPGGEPLVFASSVMPILRRECVECHGADKSKGGLRLDSLAAIVKGGDNGAVVTPGHGASSPLVKRMLLPGSDDDHMPPSEKPQPTSGEIDLLRWWIDRGANDTLRVRDAIVPEGARTILGRTLDGSGAAPPSGAAAPASAVGAATQAASAPSAAASASTSVASTTKPGANRLAYHDVIAPMLATACGKCHGDQKQKGKLRVDSLAALTAGGKGGAGIVPGSASQGTVLGRLRLPAADEKHMPPREEPQLSGPQIAMLAAWIGSGASDSMPASELPRGVGSAPAGAAGAKTSAAPAAPAQKTTPETASSTTAAATAAPDVHVDAGPGKIALYQDVVAPLLARRCGECHAGSHSEGGMRVDDLAKLVKDKDLVPGKPGDSPLVQRMALPIKDADRMPPPEKPPVDGWETAAVSAWIAQGGTADAVVAIADLPESIRSALHLEGPGGTTVAASPTTSGTPAAPPGTVVPLRASGCGACTVGSTTDHAGPSLGIAAVLLGGLGARRRRGRRTEHVDPARLA